ncbi:hypothetical protein P0F65_14080 [Sphingomonas sp. I4]
MVVVMSRLGSALPLVVARSSRMRPRGRNENLPSALVNSGVPFDQSTWTPSFCACSIRASRASSEGMRFGGQGLAQRGRLARGLRDLCCDLRRRRGMGVAG